MIFADLRERYAAGEEPLRSERRVELAGLVLAGLVLLQLLWLLASYLLPARVEVLRPAPESMKVEEIGQVGTLTADQSRGIRARPVFWDSRRPLDPLPAELAADDAAEATAAGKVLEGLTLSGIVANDRESRVIVTFKGEQQRLAPGQDVGGWTLRTVRPGEAVFEDSGREVVLRLRPRPVVAAAEAPESAAGAIDARPVPAGAREAMERLQGEAQKKTKTEQEEEPRLSLGG